jgi:hypothetical protein
MIDLGLERWNIGILECKKKMLMKACVTLMPHHQLHFPFGDLFFPLFRNSIITSFY